MDMESLEMYKQVYTYIIGGRNGLDWNSRSPEQGPGKI